MSDVPLRTDEECLQRHLDLQPGDLVSRLVLADLFEEQGRDDEAKAQRLLAKMKLWPDNDLRFCNQAGWHWWSRTDGEHRHRKHARIPTKLQRHMPTGEWLYATRLEAEAIFVIALSNAGKL